MVSPLRCTSPASVKSPPKILETLSCSLYSIVAPRFLKAQTAGAPVASSPTSWDGGPNPSSVNPPVSDSDTLPVSTAFPVLSLPPQHTTPVTDKGATAASSKPSSSRSSPLFFVKRGDVVRRLSSSELRTAVANGEFAPDDLIRKSEKDKWTTLSKVTDLDFNKLS